MKSMPQPKVSIITTVYNAVATVEQTILSVLNQSYTSIEYIVVDGGSKDGTLQIIDRYRDRITHMISEPDKGIADGFNKGIKLATGEWIGMINADDWYTENAIETIMNNVGPADDVCCGDILLKGENGFERIKNSRIGWLNYGMYIMHPTCFVRAEVYRRTGPYDSSLRIAMDFDMFLRIKNLGYRIKYVNAVIACMRTGGASNDVVKMHREELTVMRRHLGDVSLLLAAAFNYLNRLRWRFFYHNPFTPKLN
jgi:glycosyltransferase involved in cell wall biosynthesis